MTPTLTVHAQETGIRALRDRLDGDLVVPGAADWDEARFAWNLAHDQHPAAVVYPESVDDVVAVIAFARDRGFRLNTQGTGHFANSLEPLDDTILVKTSRLRGLDIDPEARTARAEAGVLWGEVSLAATEHGLAGLAGSSPDVGVVGYTLGGGLGWLARRYGLAANSVLAVELVTADGRRVRADRDNEPDLFWALRGGGGSFGIVTAVEFALYPVPEVYAGALFFPFERAGEVLKAWRGWVEGTPVELTSIGRLLQFPPIPDLPEPLRGQSFAIVEAAYIGTEDDGAALLQPLRDLGPAMDTFAMIPVEELRRLHMDPPQPAHSVGDGFNLDDATAETLNALLAVAGPCSGSPLVSVELRQLGGAVAEPSTEHGAVGTIDAGFTLFAVGVGADEETTRFVEARVAALEAALRPWTADRGHFNFANSPREGESFFPPDTYRGLQWVKAAYDPTELFRASHPIRPASPR
jgi:FAD/FMN-containing dehydrogenase